MKQSMVMEKYPVSEMDIMKSETTFTTVDEVIAYLKDKIDRHPVAAYIATFDHYTHTKNLGDAGTISEDILDAKNIICCFGKVIPNPKVLAVRPRSIGVAEMVDSFVVSFLEAPSTDANNAMEMWVKGVVSM